MNSSVANSSTKRRLPLAVVLAGSLAIGGVGAGALLVPATADQVASQLSAATPAADVPPIYTDYLTETVPVARGTEKFIINEELTGADGQPIVLDARDGILVEGEALEIIDSAYPNTGSVNDGYVENGRAIYEMPAPDDWLGARQLSVGVVRPGPEGEPGTFLGGAKYITERAPELVTDVVDDNDGTPLVPTGSTTWVIDLPPTIFDLQSASVDLFYPAVVEGSEIVPEFFTLDLTGFEIVDDQLIITDPQISQLTAGRGYFLTIHGPEDQDQATVWLGVYDAPTEPSEEPTETPTSEPTEEPSETPTNEPTDEPSETPTNEPTDEPSETPTNEPTEEPSESPTGDSTDGPTNEPTDEATESPSNKPTEQPTESQKSEAPDKSSTPPTAGTEQPDSDDDKLADTGVRQSITWIAGTAIGLIVFGGVLAGVRRRGRHS